MLEKRAMMKFVHLVMSDSANPHSFDAVNSESINSIAFEIYNLKFRIYRYAFF